MIRKIIFHPYLFFAVMSCLFLWPISLQIFTVKNDALTYYYPVRALISDALHSGNLPLWTPYINMGYPIHADMQSGAWNPVVWFIAWLTNYSLAGFHLELLLYFTLAGIGFYQFGRSLGWSLFPALIVATCYQFSGFMLDNVQFFVCLPAAAWLPFLMRNFLQLLKQYQLKDAIACAVFLSLILTGSYPALLIIIGYFLATVLIWHFIQTQQKIKALTSLLLPLGISFLTFCLLSLPAILSFVNHLPFIDRGQTQTLSFVQQNSLVPASLISLISPFSSTANAAWLNTNPLMRSSYLGFIPLCFIIFGLWKYRLYKQTVIQLFTFSAGMFWLLSFGSHFFVHGWAYYILPLANTFRHTALYRLISIFSMLTIAGYALQNYQTNPLANAWKKYTIRVCITVVLLSLILCLLHLNELKSFPDLKHGVSGALLNSKFIWRYTLQIIMLLPIIWLVGYVSAKPHFFKTLLFICLAELFIFTQLNMPVTLIGARKFSEVVNILQRNTTAFPLPTLTPVKQATLLANDSLQICGSRLPYIKIIGRNDYYITPGNLRTQEQFHSSILEQKVFDNTFLYAADSIFFAADSLQHTSGKGLAFVDSFSHISPIQQSSHAIISLKQFDGNSLSATTAHLNFWLVLLQNNYPGWTASIDGKVAKIENINHTYQAIAVSGGKHEISFTYQPRFIKSSFIASLAAWILLIFAAIMRLRFFGKER